MDEPLVSPVDSSPAGKQESRGRVTGQGTYFSSVFTLLTAAMGTGVLTLPYSVLCVGIVPAVALIAGYGIVMALTLYIYVRTAHNDGSTSLAMLSGVNLGKTARRLMEITTVIYCMFSCVGCFIVVADITKEPVSYFICNSTPCVWTERYILQSVAGIFMLPPLFLREITSLRFSAVLGILSVFFIAVVIVVRGAAKFKTNWPTAWNTNANNLNHWGALFGIPNICMSFQCQVSTIEVYSEMRPDIKSVKLMMSAVATAVTIEIIVYAVVAVFGYVTFLGATGTNILSAYVVSIMLGSAAATSRNAVCSGNHTAFHRRIVSCLRCSCVHRLTFQRVPRIAHLFARRRAPPCLTRTAGATAAGTSWWRPRACA